MEKRELSMTTSTSLIVSGSIVKLTKNWRSHESILQFPNEFFYGNEVLACGDPVVINSYVRGDILITPGFPIIFHAITGKDEREAGSPSFFNRPEASLVKEYVNKLMADRRVRISKSLYPKGCELLRMN
jgi:helicase MOV-10